VAASRALVIEEVELPEMVLSGLLADLAAGFLAGYALAQLACAAIGC